jgi:hypothetical protein
MKILTKLISQLLIVSMMLLPFSTQAGMIGTEQVLTNAAAQANLDKVRDYVSRTDVQKQFEALGLTASTAQDRVNAMTQDEINRIAGKIDTLPAGANDIGWWWIAIVALVGLIVWYNYR